MDKVEGDYDGPSNQHEARSRADQGFRRRPRKDPDGNGWLLQEITTRFPGREWEPQAADVATLAELLHETSEHHDHFEKMHGKHNWWDWYAPYLKARQNGSRSEEASATADRYMEKILLT